MADDNWPPAPVDWLAITIDESKPVTEDKPAATTGENKPVTEDKLAPTTDENKPVTEDKPAATTDESEDKANTTGDAPVTEALPTIKFARQNCILILTDQEGNPAAIGSLRAAESPACTIQLGSLTQNRETSVALHACFPKFASRNKAAREQFQRMGFYFYGNAFQSFESDFEITYVTELSDLHEILADRVSVLKAIIGKNLYKLQLTYKPQKVVTKAKDDPDEFSMPESSHAAGLFRYLVKCESLTTITLYFCATGEDIDALNDIRDRLKQEKDNKPFNEYRDKNGKIVIRWNSTFGPWCDVRSRLPSELNFRFPEQHAVTLAYGEIRDHAHSALMARSRLTTPVKISFVAFPGSTQENEVPSKYIGFVDIVRLEALLEVGLFKVGSTATLCFHQPLPTVEPEGWQCVVRPEMSNVEHPGTIVLIATRPTGSEQQVNVAKYPSLNMRAESEYSVWLYPQGSDRRSRQLVDCANKILYGEQGEGIKHLLKRQDLQKFCAGLEFSSLPTTPAGLFLKSRLTSIQRKELNVLEARCSEDQRAALHEIYSCRSWVNIIQGPPGTGKTTFAAEILIKVFKLFGLKANCYASSDAATDVFVSKVAPELKPMRYHGLDRELTAVYRAAEKFQKDSKPPQNEDEPTSRQLTLRLFEDTIKQMDYIVTPCHLAGEKFFRNSTSPDIVIIDEAGSARELETLMVMYHNLNSAVMFIILGDPNQSPVVPSVNREVEEDDPYSFPYNIFAAQLATSLMARQIANGIHHSTFTKI